MKSHKLINKHQTKPVQKTTVISKPFATTTSELCSRYDRYFNLEQLGWKN